ncbi:MAG: glutamate synthase subunit beta [Rhodospirillaceae bacterium]|jgi:glutamate synthase (NADPH) small chain|nr:glutamate synthase subunit beta [Rhodospirillaceae bacterium]MBT5308582.1 glutamate synthase subunit beta [Rhodospirillaceae bacterium]MBT6407361.1 glutamate synthase subunit beta [Rhodospirillaceae bacterium]MBT7355487.1 glutamate synthase subunit beta [Rhodospirillaceae bacterium]
MGKPTGFKEFDRQDRGYVSVEHRIVRYDEMLVPLDDDVMNEQSARCMDCGIPFCHNGCPVNNIIPDWNDLVYHHNWEEALDVLHSTNNFPEFTGRICPAPCEAACTLNLTDEPVTIKSIECAIIDRAWSDGRIEPQVPKRLTGKRVAVVGSGPSGMAAAQQMARAGHSVVVFEKNAKIGGLLRYGIPDFKLDKKIIDRRMSQMQAEGVEFRPNSHVGHNVLPERLLIKFDAVVLTGGSEAPRDLPVPGRELNGVHFAMDFLTQQNRRNGFEPIDDAKELTAKDKHVIVIGGGDTGSDCVGTSARQGAASITQMEIMPKPPEMEDKSQTWPNWPNKLRSSTSHDEGCKRQWSIGTECFEGKDGQLTTLKGHQVDWTEGGPKPVEGTEFDMKADLVLLAMGFVNPVHEGMLDHFGIEYDGRGNVNAATEGENAYKTSIDKVFAAGDMRRGQSLVVWAIREGRQCARAVDEYLMGSSELPR